jgi:hypothetical protein
MSIQEGEVETPLDYKKYLYSKSSHNSSNLARVNVVSICLGPSAVAVMKGRLQTEKG